MNKVSIELRELLPIMQEKLQDGGEISFTVSGTSMQPMVFDRKDTVTIKKLEGRLKKYDVPFYRRDNGQFVFHRIVKVQKNGNYTCRGDNQVINEPDVRHDQIIGVLTSFNRRGKTVVVGKSFWYDVYCRLWMAAPFFKRVKNYLFRIRQKLKGKK